MSSSRLEHDHVRLEIMRGKRNLMLYLDIPVNIIKALCLKSRKYLIFLAWCILGLDGEADSMSLGIFTENGEIHKVDDAGDVNGGEIYRFIADDVEDISRAVVDLEAIKARTGVPSEGTVSRNQFRTQLLKRDSCCVWTGAEYGAGLHIIPYERGSEWLKLIVDSRSEESDEDLDDLEDINDIRNGVFATSTIHAAFDPRDLVILKTPNRILNTTDIPPRANRTIPPDVRYPADQSRYTLQWLVPSITQNIISNNLDAAFAKYTKLKKPSALLLHYNYGAAAVKLWGHGVEVLQALGAPHRPRPPAPMPVGPPKEVHDRTIVIRKREEAEAQAAGADPPGQGHQATWDEDDVMLFFWGNSKAATKRYNKAREEKRQNLEKWREGVESAF